MIKNEWDWWNLVNESKEQLADIIHEFAEDLEGDFEEAIIDRDKLKVFNILSEAWNNAPDNPMIHSIPGWGNLCDLCSEFDSI